MKTEKKVVTLTSLTVGDSITAGDGIHKVKITRIWVDGVHLENPTVMVDFDWEIIGESVRGAQVGSLKIFMAMMVKKS